MSKQKSSYDRLKKALAKKDINLDSVIEEASPMQGVLLPYVANCHSIIDKTLERYPDCPIAEILKELIDIYIDTWVNFKQISGRAIPMGLMKAEDDTLEAILNTKEDLESAIISPRIHECLSRYLENDNKMLQIPGSLLMDASIKAMDVMLRGIMAELSYACAYNLLKCRKVVDKHTNKVFELLEKMPDAKKQGIDLHNSFIDDRDIASDIRQQVAISVSKTLFLEKINAEIESYE